MSERDDGLYLADMWDAIEKIERYVGSRSFEEFTQDDMAYDAVMRQLTVLGEAAANVGDTLQSQHPEIPWHKIKGMRNRLMHEYSNVENDIVWDTCSHDLPILKQALEPLIES